MDTPTKIGIGGVGLGAALAFLTLIWPNMPLWISIPGFVISAGVALWGFSPLLGSLTMGHVGLWNVPLRRAAQIAYEKCEGKFVGNFVTRMFATEHERLTYFFHSFNVQGTPLFAKTPPSTRRRPIPARDLKSLSPIEGTDDLAYITASKVPVYRDTVVRRIDLWRALRHLRQLNKQSDL